MAKQDKPETKKVSRQELAAQLGELVLKRSKLTDELNKVATQCNEIATKMETMK